MKQIQTIFANVNSLFQVNFNYRHDGTNNENVRNLAGLDRDCFIIPVHSLERFLPAGVPMPVCIFFVRCNLHKNEVVMYKKRNVEKVFFYL